VREISIGVVLIMCFGNLRGIREAGKAFALPTYLFTGSVVLMIVVGLVREVMGNLHPQDIHTIGGTYPIGAGTAGVTSIVVIFTLARSFANGGSSLTGIEAVSNAVSAFRPPEGINARRVLVAEGIILGTLVAGISWLAHLTHAVPHLSGFPTVIAQEADLVFGQSAHFMFFVVQATTALILYTGGNTSFNGFPFLTSFVAEDSFLPRWMTKRGHRLVFSNGIIVLTVLAVTLLAVVGSNVNRLVPFYAIGVFTAFSMAGFGMAKYHHRVKEPGWRHKRVINFSSGVRTAIVVLIFAVVKFTEGAWLIVIIFPLLVFALIKLNGRYRLEAKVLGDLGGRKPPKPPNYARRVVLVFVDDFNLATIAALRYANGLRPTVLRAVHFVIDQEQADALRDEWLRAERGIALGELRLARGASKANLAGTITICPPSALNDLWTRRFPDPVAAFASGWMRVRARARQQGVALPLVISDHADWDRLTATIAATGASEIWVTHGQEDALIHWCATRGLKARPLDIVGYGDEEGEESGDDKNSEEDS